MKILVLNCGSSSVKYQLIEMEKEQLICKGVIERIGTQDAIVRYQPVGREDKREVRPVADFVEAIDSVLSDLLDPEIGVIEERSEIAAVGHRVVHGGEDFASSVLIDQDVIASIERCVAFAPLHNPANLKGIEVCMQLLPGTPQVAVFDTAFHQTMPPASYMYALPAKYYRELGVRRYGFHGTSHRYVAQQAARVMGCPIEELKIITCHLGNGASVAAVKYGRSVDTSMGFTPLEGLVMGTRSGDIDPALVLYLMDVDGLEPDQMDTLLNKQSGMLGLTDGFSHDMRDIEGKATNGDEQCNLALDVYCHRIKKYIGAFAAVMGGVDVVVFTGGIGERSPLVRRRVCHDMAFLGIVIDQDGQAVNEAFCGGGRAKTAHLSSGPTKVLVLETNEELVIARDTQMVLFG
ncbi:MAG: acetate kinase [Anaerolineae bacterium]|nr:acetate kinase [Anaerolineae bacterium]